MNYPDSKRRIEELKKLEAIFNKRAFLGTASKIYALSFSIEEPVPKRALTREYYELLMTFADEFSNRFPYGQEYRRKCFTEIADLIFKAVVSTEPSKFRKSFLDLEPILLSINRSKKTIDEISKALKGVGKEAGFHLICYSYLIITEGIFDEVARSLYFFSTFEKGEGIAIGKLMRMEVNTIYKKIEPKPIILRDWQEKKHIRNAIGHATVYYDLSNYKLTFIDNHGEVTFQKTYTFRGFV